MWSVPHVPVASTGGCAFGELRRVRAPGGALWKRTDGKSRSLTSTTHIALTRTPDPARGPRRIGPHVADPHGGNLINVTSGERRDISVDELSDMERSRLLLGWLAARRAVDNCLSDLLAAGPAGERRVRESLALVDDLESRAQEAFDRYRTAAENTEARSSGRWVPSDADRPRLNVVRAPEGDLARSRSNTKSNHRHR
ncbi:hypothetical protein Francci3_0073 [Frankia casuarinae]|uniref:Uncharacterized protein n=1 Tax=Frankia casuarinae (strain DSM 45818 / CECT 9043 / HFP020203 / CcI3) TaxID=106370 RepID=Q2JGX5_FRACC|nr:hypothetical protein Francci3_0073 [Frankia casuarinae]